MPLDLAAAFGPGQTAVITMELQRAVAGDLASLPHLRDALAERGTLGNVHRLLRGARAAGLPVVHCTVGYRADRRGTATNAPMLAVAARHPAAMAEGSEGCELVPEVDAQPSDVVVSRTNGLSPFGGTSLDTTLRALGATAVVVAGVSVNIGVFGTAVEAVNLGYRVAVATDAVVGVPPAYGDSVLANSIALLATLATTDQLLDAWGQGLDTPPSGVHTF